MQAHTPAASSEGVMSYDRREWEDRQLQALEEKIAERLRSVCEHVPDEEFKRLIERMARVQRKYEQLRSTTSF
jgi:hypothetical protein